MFAVVCDASVQMSLEMQCAVPANVISVIRSKSSLDLLTSLVISAHFRDDPRQKNSINQVRDVKLSLGDHKHIQ